MIEFEYAEEFVTANGKAVWKCYVGICSDTGERCLVDIELLATKPITKADWVQASKDLEDTAKRHNCVRLIVNRPLAARAAAERMGYKPVRVQYEKRI